MMSQSNSNLPSVNDFIKNSDELPSIDDFIVKESLEELPSVKEFIKEDKVEEEIIEEPVAEKSGDLTEILRLINDVRKDIPEIPEIKSYDKELEKLCEIVDQVRSEIPVVPEIKYYDAEIETICEQIDSVKEYIANSISSLPEVKYYDNQIEVLEEKLDNVKNTISELPEVRYYENDLQSIKEEIQNVQNNIPSFPKWINEINEVPDFSWIGKTFSVIEDDFTKINNNVNTLKDNLNLNLEQLSETIDTKRFESKVEIDELNKNLQEAKDNIWKELRESSLKIWEYHKEFKDDDRKLKKQIVSEYNSLKQNLEGQLKKVNRESIKTDELLLKYFAELKEQVSTFPEVKYYDDEIVDVRKEIGSVKVDINELYKIVRDIKSSQKNLREDLREGLLNEPAETKNSDPLTPLDKNFATLDDLQNHYRLFINRIQQQLSTLGGGGETRLEFLDDVDRDSVKVDGRFLKYDATSGKWIGVVGGGGSQTLDDTLGLGNTSSLGMSVGVITATNLNVSGNLGVGTVGINSIFSTTDIQSWYYTNNSKLVSGDDATPQAVYVGAAGTAMFIVGDSGNDVNQYTLSTPYDVSTAGASIAAFSVATQETNPLGIDFNPTGTKMFISGNTGVAPLIASGDYVHEYSLSTAWTVSSAGYTTSFNITQDTAPGGVTFGDSGSKMYVVGSTGDAVYQYSLSTPYSLASGVTYDNISLALGTLETTPTDISFNSTGTVLWVVGSTNDRIYEFRLGTAWDISTAVFYDDVYIGFNEITVTGLQVIPEQNVAYIVGSNSDTVFQYSTNTPAIEIASSGISSESSIVLNNETRVKDKLYVKGIAHFDSNILAQTTMQVDGTLTASTAVTFETTTSTLNFGTSQTTGILQLGGTSQTGSITLGRATTSQTLGIATGVSGVGTTKTINLGTGGASGSFTQINIGPTAGVGTITVNSGTNLGIGGVTNPSVPLVVNGTSRFFTSGAGDVTISHSNLVSSIKGASTVQLALGANNTDVIRINNSGLVGIGTTNPTSTLHVVGSSLITGISTVGLGSTSTPPSNSQMSFELISDTNLRIKVRGTDGVLRSADITLT
jgi:hypothetical protein